MYEKKFPEVFGVEKITGIGAYVSLTEYAGIEALFMSREYFRKRVNNIKIYDS